MMGSGCCSRKSFRCVPDNTIRQLEHVERAKRVGSQAELEHHYPEAARGV